MFASGMREASQQQVVIDDAELRVFMAMLEHLYTDTVEIPTDIALPLLCTADRFGVERLKALCAAKLEAELSPTTACAVLVIADRHSAAELREASVAYIVSHFAEMHSTDEFKREMLGQPALLEEVHSSIAARLPAVPVRQGSHSGSTPNPSPHPDRAPSLSRE